MKFPFPFKATEIRITTTTTTSTSAAPSWPWPSCVTTPRTLSFRANTTSHNIYKAINSAYLDDKNATDEPYFNICKSFEHYHDGSESEPSNPQPHNDVESAVISGLRSDRLFFEPGETSSILESAKLHESSYKDSVTIMAMESSDPFLDFRVSMEEMVEAHGLKEWKCLDELLECYLKVNDKCNHGYIVGAFVDLLIHLSMVSTSPSDDCSAIDENCSSTATQYSFTSPFSFSSSICSSSISPCLSSLEIEDEIDKNGENCSSSVLHNPSSAGVK